MAVNRPLSAAADSHAHVLGKKSKSIIMNINEERDPVKSIFAYLWNIGKVPKAIIAILGLLLFVSYLTWNSFTDNQKERILDEYLNEDQKWWDKLEYGWKIQLMISAEINPIDHSKLSKEEFEKVAAIVDIDLDNSQVQNLSPFNGKKFYYLKRIYHGKKLNSINGIKNIPNLTYLDIDSSNVTDISESFTLSNLRAITMLNSKVPKSQIELLKNKKHGLEIRY